MAQMPRYICIRCAGFDERNTAQACITCGTDTEMHEVVVTQETTGTLSVSVPEHEPRLAHTRDDRQMHGDDPRRQQPQ